MIVVTGGAGFIGANLVRKLNDRGFIDIVVVDNLEHSDKFRNLSDCQIRDYMDKNEFRDKVRSFHQFHDIEVIFHQGACSDTMESNGRYMLDNNFTYSKELFEYCRHTGVRFIYASSAAVYGVGQKFREVPGCEAPVNIYAYSKLLFDQYVRLNLPDVKSQVVGLRYFNVYGEREQHKGRMASVIYHFYREFVTRGVVSLFEGSGGYDDGEQQRDFVFVEDVAKVNLYFLDQPERSGIYNVGTGVAQSFNDIAVAVIKGVRKYRGDTNLSLAELISEGMIEYVPFPPNLLDKYQSYTQADTSELKRAGYIDTMSSAAQGVARYIDCLWHSESTGSKN
ncbi:MAG: ADP-glyceromanno-heptose 6-epimerase [Gammaproteobacteria bacterium]|nr:ADP-glyceromanno-heptose 6-epimerase [Gammaproteobacteria bacterium]